MKHLREDGSFQPPQSSHTSSEGFAPPSNAPGAVGVCSEPNTWQHGPRDIPGTWSWRRHTKTNVTFGAGASQHSQWSWAWLVCSEELLGGPKNLRNWVELRITPLWAHFAMWIVVRHRDKHVPRGQDRTPHAMAFTLIWNLNCPPTPPPPAKCVFQNLTIGL